MKSLHMEEEGIEYVSNSRRLAENQRTDLYK